MLHSAPLSIAELEAGLRALDSGRVDREAFWDANIAAFRQTVLVALQETSEALKSERVPPDWRIELETQVEGLRHYLELADGHMGARGYAQRPPHSSLH